MVTKAVFRQLNNNSRNLLGRQLHNTVKKQMGRQLSEKVIMPAVLETKKFVSDLEKRG